MLRKWAILKCLSLLVAAALLTNGEARAQSPATTPSPAGDAAKARARLQEGLQRRREAEARLDQTLANPTANAPRWMHRASERSKAAKAAAAKGKTP